MANRFRFITKTFLLTINSIVVILFLLACFAPLLNPQRWWFISFLGYAFPFILAAIIAFLVFWLIVKRKLALLPAIALVIGFKSIAVFFAFNIKSNYTEKKAPKTLRVVSWNVARFIEMKKNNNKGSQTRLKMLEQLKQQNADVLCLQEFHTAKREDYYDNIKYIQQELKYPYYAFSFDEDGSQLYYSSIIFSKFPIADNGLSRYPRPAIPDVLIHADIRFNGKLIRVYTTRLQSHQLRKTDYENIEAIKKGNEGALAKTRSLFGKVRTAVSNHKLQADMINEVLSDCPYPFIFCADLNDIPNSYTYKTIRADLQDAFLEKGFGVGRTFSSISPTLRIDYIFADNNFRVLQYNRLVNNYSDHYMISADLAI